MPRLGELRFEQPHGLRHQPVEIHRLHFGRRHLGEIAEAPDDLLQVGQLRQQRGRAFAEDFVELLGIARRAPAACSPR